MQLVDAAAWATIVGTAVALLALWLSVRTARSNHQRELRKRLRDQLRDINVACDMYFGRDFSNAVNKPPKYSPQAIRQIRQDGLLSPNSAHIERLESLLLELFDVTHVGGQLVSHIDGEEYDQYMAQNRHRLENTLTELDVRSKDYLTALGQMDNGNFVTYLRYRFLAP
jgi:hypothetical protein